MDINEKKSKVLQIDTNIKPRIKCKLTDKQKRYSTSCLLENQVKSKNSNDHGGHKRSLSLGNETMFLPRNHSVPNLISKSMETKNSIKNMSKKKWFQLPRIGLKRQASTPPKRGYGGLKPGLVEPPEPPPQLLFNLDWSSYNQLCEFNSQELLVRRGSCPNYKQLENSPPMSPTHQSKIITTSKLFSNFQRPVLKRGHSNDGQSNTPSTSSSTSSMSSISQEDTQKFVLSNVYEPNSNKVVIHFGRIKTRSNKRKAVIKNELKALHIWQNELIDQLNRIKASLSKQNVIPFEKTERYIRTRKFILREFYTTEINFWNQLNYTKVMFSDPLHLAIDRHSDVIKSNDIDLFSNLYDLMKFSSTLILRLWNAQMKSIDGPNVYKDVDVDPECQTCPSDVNIGYLLCEMAESMVIFLRCAVDYKANKKTLDQRIHNKAYALYNEKLALRKETRQFTLHDYLIIPIQRITRYGLLLADLEKHTESTHPDYHHIRIARCIIASLAAAMNSAQKK